MHLTRSKGQVEFTLNLELGKLERETRKNRAKQKNSEFEQEMEGNAPRNGGQPEGNENAAQERKFGDLFEPRFDRLRMNQAADEQEYHMPPHLISLIINGHIFQGLENEDPLAHLTSFLNTATACKPQGMPQDLCSRVLFPFSLRGQAIHWFESSGLRGAANFDEVRQRFLTKYFPPSKMDQMRMALHQFRQHDGEAISTAWERFQDLLNKCPNLMMDPGYELQLFYNGLSWESQGIVNASAGGSLKELSMTEVRDLFQRIAENGCKWPNDGARGIKKQAGVLEVEAMTQIQAQLAAMQNEFRTGLRTMQQQQQGLPLQVLRCGVCQGDHHNEQCPLLQEQQCNYVNNFQRPNQGWNNAGNFQQQQNRPQNWGNPGQSSSNFQGQNPAAN